MKRICITLTIAASLSAAGAVDAEQRQDFGRGSLYSVPGGAPTSVVTVPVNRFGRDSVYASQTPSAPSTPVAANAESPQQFGRDSVYAYKSPNPSAPTNGETKVGSTAPGHGG